MQQNKTLLAKILYRLGYEVGFAVYAIGKLVEFIRYPFPK